MIAEEQAKATGRIETLDNYGDKAGLGKEKSKNTVVTIRPDSLVSTVEPVHIPI